MSTEDLLFLLEQSREKNRRIGITGILLYKDGNIMQMIEGEKQVVLELFETIKKDRRHKDVFQVIAGDIQQRNFENWSMGFLNMDKVGDDYPKFNKYFDENIVLRNFQDDAQSARSFMIRFNNINQ